MRSFFAKIFFCMLLVPVLARGCGVLLEFTLSDPRPGTERMLLAVTPAVATLAGSSLAHADPRQLQSALDSAGGGLIRLALAPASGCAGLHGSADTLPVGHSGYCITVSSPPRPLILGVIPGSWWFIMPVLELLFCACVSFFLARYLADPIRRTRAAAAAFAAGDMQARASGDRFRRRRDEAADLAREFDRMAGHVSAMIAAQHRFIGDVSHEIRSPLARLAMALGLARREAAPELASRLDRMEQEIDSVSALVRELLALASLQGTTDPPRPARIDLSELIDHVIEDMIFEFRERAHGIRVLRRPGPAWVSGNAGLLRRAVENVIRNALFYTPDGTEVDVLLERAEAGIRLIVRDHGPGVPDSALSELFRPFFRVDEARARHTGGVGLGLAIAHRAVELHGGRISAANVRPHGLSIRIELPEAAPEVEAGIAPGREPAALTTT